MDVPWQFAAETSEKTGLAVLGIDLLALVLQLATFLLLFLILKKFALKPIVAMLERRRKTIDKGVRLGQAMEEEKQRLEAEVNQKLHQAREEADRIIAASHQEAGEIVKEAEDTAMRKAERLLVDAQARVDEDVKRARAGLEQETLTLVAEATEKLIGERLDPKKDAALISRALKGAKS